jgi:hypothetical protein
MKDPVTPYEWQLAIDMAHGALSLDSARLYGLVTGGPVVNVERCQEILVKGKAAGYCPSRDSVEKFVAACQCGFGRGEARPAKCTGKRKKELAP